MIRKMRYINLKAKKVTVGAGLTVNTGNFNSQRFDVSLELELEDSEKASDAVQKASEQVRGQLEEEMVKFLKQMDATPKR